MGIEKQSNDSVSGFPTKALAWAGGMAAAALLPALKGGNIAGVSRLLAIFYLATWGALACRHALHLLEGYYKVGMGRAMVCELGTLVVWGLAAAMVIAAENPQVPRLLICSGGVAIVFFFSSTRMEKLREKEMCRREIRIRRATEVFRESRIWRFICRSFSQIDFEFARWIREILGGEDSKAGNLSLLAAIALFVPVVIALIGASVVVASTVFPIPLTPPHPKPPNPRPPRQGNEQVGGSGSSQAGSTGYVGLSHDCEEGHTFGAHVPEPERTSLLLAWEDVPGVDPGRMEALGYEVAGCPGRANPIPGQEGAWYAAGYCGEELKAIAVAPPGLEHPVVMLEQAADFVLPLIRKGEFAGAIDRFPVGEGDAYVIDTNDGSYVLIRDRSSGGPLPGGTQGAGDCGRFSDQDVRYTVAEPGLLNAWRTLAAVAVGGVYPIDYAGAAHEGESVAFRSPEGIMATGLCSLATMTCTVTIGEDEIEGRLGAFIDEREVKALVEG